jgi:hypothetical protein
MKAAQSAAMKVLQGKFNQWLDWFEGLPVSQTSAKKSCFRLPLVVGNRLNPN